MIVIDISESSIKYFRIKKNLFDKLVLAESQIIHYPSGEDIASILPKSLKGEEVTISIADSMSYIHRFPLPKEPMRETPEKHIRTKAQAVVPEAIDNLLCDIERVGDYDMFFSAVAFESIAPITQAVAKKEGKIRRVVTQSTALFYLMRSETTPDSLTAFLDIEEDHLSMIFFDSRAPFISFYETTTPQNREKTINLFMDHVKELYGSHIARVIIAGPESTSLDLTEFQEREHLELVDIHTVFETIKKKEKIIINPKHDSPFMYLPLYGLLMLENSKSQFNILHKYNLEQLADYLKTKQAEQIEQSDKDSIHPPNDDTVTPDDYNPDSDEEEASREFLTDPYKIPTINMEEEDFETAQKTVNTRLRMLLGILIVSVLILAGTLGWRSYSKQQDEANQLTILPTLPAVSPSPDISPSPTVIPVDRTEVRILVLNGTGEAGVAGAMEELLRELGYEQIETGNAEESDFEETIISMYNDEKNYLDILTQDLENDYTVSVDETAQQNEDYDIIITVGEQ